ncbi:unnamed protein product [Protopolystoma xenopodis]|uniref:Uncharacterized protein n=1 Tax=Protopolystoma xenopodis TaxID=117903 RepID=A0A3S5A3K3_9PLAT|nr:unnamed protein product [Protopolystoma xenopodis]
MVRLFGLLSDDLDTDDDDISATVSTAPSSDTSSNSHPPILEHETHLNFAPILNELESPALPALFLSDQIEILGNSQTLTPNDNQAIVSGNSEDLTSTSLDSHDPSDMQVSSNSDYRSGEMGIGASLDDLPSCTINQTFINSDPCSLAQEDTVTTSLHCPSSSRTDASPSLHPTYSGEAAFSQLHLTKPIPEASKPTVPPSSSTSLEDMVPSQYINPLNSDKVSTPTLTPSRPAVTPEQISSDLSPLSLDRLPQRPIGQFSTSDTSGMSASENSEDAQNPQQIRSSTILQINQTNSSTPDSNKSEFYSDSIV